MTASWVWILAVCACRPRDDQGGGDDSPGSSRTGETGNSGPEIPGSLTPPEDPDSLLGRFQLTWEERDHLLPSLTSLHLDATFWHEVHFGTERNVIVEARGLDTCTAFTLPITELDTVEPGDVGVLAVTLDGELFFEGEPTLFENEGTRWYDFKRPEPAFGAAVGISAPGDGVIPPLDYPLIGILPAGPIGTFTPGQGEVVRLRDLVITWDNPLGSDEMFLGLSAGIINLDCHVIDDGEWALPAEYLDLIETYSDGPINSPSAILRRGLPRYIPIGDRYLATIISTDAAWVFGAQP